MTDIRVNTVKHTPNELLWCSVCQKNLTRDEIWLSDDTRDGQLYCYNCACGDAIRLKDIAQPNS